jgi:outer membrane immunogenic protein
MTKFALLLVAGVSAVAISSATQAADLIIDEPAAGIVEAAPGSWDGVFIGGFVGYAAGELSDSFDGEGTSGWLVGANVGVNFTLTDGIVAGVVGDVAWTDLVNDIGDVELHWTGSVRGRLGFDGGAFMPYLTAGLAFGGGYAVPPDVSNTHVGWTVGAGVEFAVTDDLSVDLQYRYTDLAPQNYSGPDVGFETHSVTAGLNWSF